MNKNISKKIEELVHFQKLVYKKISPEIERIIVTKSTDIHEIEFYLDMLSNYIIDEAINAFYNLCTYYETVNPEGAKSYFELGEEIFGEEEPKRKKRI